MNKPKKLTIKLIVEEVERRGWKWEVLIEGKSYVRFWDSNNKPYIIFSDVTDKSSAVAQKIADNKELASILASEVGVSTPKTVVFSDYDEAVKFMQQEQRIVIKPLDASHGNGVTTNVTSVELLKNAIDHAKKHSKRILMQTYVSGDDYRLLYIGGKLAAAAIREPASVVGDGDHSVKELIDIENQNPDRGANYVSKLNYIALDAAELFLGKGLSRVPAKGEKVLVTGTANMGTGGKSIDVTDTLHQSVKDAANKLVEGMQLNAVYGVDFIYDKNKPDIEPAMIEINAAPSFGLHELPTIGKPRPVAKTFVDWLTG